MARPVLILGFAGVQALDLVGPFEVFTGASLYLRARTAPTATTSRVVSAHGAPVSTGTGLDARRRPAARPA